MMATRKGSLKPIDVPIDVLDRLNSGTIETEYYKMFVKHTFLV
jgi:hypothetical protein